MLTARQSSQLYDVSSLFVSMLDGSLQQHAKEHLCPGCSLVPSFDIMWASFPLQRLMTFIEAFPMELRPISIGI